MKAIFPSVVVILLVCSGILAALGCLVPLDLLVAVTCGWGFYLARVVPEITVNWGGVVTGLVCLTGFAFGLHFFLRWLFQAGRNEAMKREDSPPPWTLRSNSEGERVWIKHGETKQDCAWRPRWTVAIVGVVVLMFVSGIAAVGITHQTAWFLSSPEPVISGGIRPTVDRIKSQNNLKEITLAAHQFHDTFAGLPAGTLFDEEGRMLHGWQAQLLPYMELGALYDKIDFKKAWNHPDNAAPFRQTVRPFLSPYETATHNAEGFALSGYAGNILILGGDRRFTLHGDFPDGTAKTILLGEARGNFKPWGHPRNCRDLSLGINRSPDGFGNPGKANGANFAFADGTVRFIADNVSPEVLRALSTPNGGEKFRNADVP